MYTPKRSKGDDCSICFLSPTARDCVKHEIYQEALASNEPCLTIHDASTSGWCFLRLCKGTPNEDIPMTLTQPHGQSSFCFLRQPAILLVKSNYQQKNRNLPLAQYLVNMSPMSQHEMNAMTVQFTGKNLGDSVSGYLSRSECQKEYSVIKLSNYFQINT